MAVSSGRENLLRTKNVVFFVHSITCKATLVLMPASAPMWLLFSVLLASETWVWLQVHSVELRDNRRPSNDNRNDRMSVKPGPMDLSGGGHDLFQNRVWYAGKSRYAACLCGEYSAQFAHHDDNDTPKQGLS